MDFIKKTCKKCGKERKFRVGTPNELRDICGECWDWKGFEEKRADEEIHREREN